MANPSREYDRRALTRSFVHISHITAPCQEVGDAVQGFTDASDCVRFAGGMAVRPLS